MEHRLDPDRRTWHITFGTYGMRLHGDCRPTVDRRHNAPGTPFVARDAPRYEYQSQIMAGPAVRLSDDQRRLIEALLPPLCDKGGWHYRIAAAPPPPDNHHIHILLDADLQIHGKQIRRWLKQWLTAELNKRYSAPAGGWWAEGGSTRAVTDEKYLNNTFSYILKQRTIHLD